MEQLVGRAWPASELPTLYGIEDPGDKALEVSEELMRELAQVLKVRDVFSRISTIVNRVLPHDRMTLTFHERNQIHLMVESLDGSYDWGVIPGNPELLALPWVLFPELTPEALRDYEPVEAREALLKSGFACFLAVNVRAREQRMGVEFWSKRPNAFGPADIRLARIIANCLALAVAHEQLAAAARPETTPAPARGFAHRVHKLMEPLRSDELSRRIVGNSSLWTPILAAAGRVAETDATVLLIGESGTGKEVIARYIHSASARRNGPFVAVNCAALPEQLLESELFGFERGAFTGATHAKPGQFELAAGGVLFLDEVSEMSMSAQAKLLRLLQEREFRRLGGTRLMKSDVRVIAATNVDLQRAIQQSVFRRDLYYRLRVVDLRLPALRDRRDDILPLADVLLDEIAPQVGSHRPSLTPAAKAALLSYHWPGNVRELRNVLERATILCDRNTIDADDLSFDDAEPAAPAAQGTNLNVVERDLIERVLRECGGNKSLTAKRLGLSRMQLYVRLRRYDLAS